MQVHLTLQYNIGLFYYNISIILQHDNKNQEKYKINFMLFFHTLHEDAFFSPRFRSARHHLAPAVSQFRERSAH